jgi:4-hydroxy-tetrahydrodipicolinate reductase
MVGLAVTGASGRMGRELIVAARERDGCEVALAVNRGAGGESDGAGGTTDDPAGAADGDHGESVAGVPVADAAALPALLNERDPDVLVDFTAPESSVGYVEAAADAGVAAVVGTTGFAGVQREQLREASERAPVLLAPNFSRGVQALLAAVREAAERLPGYDVEVTETHHDGKRDAPSGTADHLVEVVEDVRGPAEHVHGREGDAPRNEGEIGVHARRAGDVTGEHGVLLAGNREVVELRHRAGDRGVFAEGALDAADWLAGRDPGWYEFADAVGGDDPASEGTRDDPQADDLAADGGGRQ